jgi:ATP-dependent Zn protease
VQRLLEEGHEAVYRLLADARDNLDELVSILLQEETIDQDTLVQILGPRPEVTEEVPHVTNA